MKVSLRLKIMGYIAVLMIIPMAVVGVLINRSVTNDLTANIDRDNQAMVDSLEQESTSYVERTISLIEVLVGTSEIKNRDFNAQFKLFEQIAKAHPEIQSIYMGFPDLPGLPSIYPVQQLPADYDARKRPWYQGAMSKNGLFITDMYLDGSTKLPVVSVAQPVKDSQGKVIGILAIDLSLDKLSNIVADKSKDGFTTYITDNKGNIIAHPDKKMVTEGKNIDSLDFVKKALSGQAGVEKYDTGKEIHHVAYKKSESLGYGLFSEQPMEAALAPAKAMSKEIAWTNTMAVILAMLTGIFAIEWFLLAPIKRLVRAAQGIAEGDLAQKVNIKTKDELGILGTAFNAMVANTRDVVEKLQHAIEQIALSTEELSASAQEAASTAESIGSGVHEAIAKVDEDTQIQTQNVRRAQGMMNELVDVVDQVAQSAQEQALYVSNTSEQINQMVGSLQEIQRDTEVLAAVTDQASQTADKGSKAVADTVSGMVKIKSSVFDTAEKINNLGTHSQQIGEIVEVIGEIAEQTNLLALNAAIEAARAGEHGKGFAVVADEVRKLAERASKSTREIGILLENIKNGIEGAIDSTRTGTKEAEEGSKLASTAGESLRQIMETVEQTIAQVGKISDAAQSIGESSAEIAKAVDSMAAITEENSASTEEMAANAAQVGQEINNIAQVSSNNADTVRHVGDATASITHATATINETIQDLNAMSQEVQNIVTRFRL